MNRATRFVLAAALAVILAAGGFIGGFVTARSVPAVSLPAIVKGTGASTLGKRIDEVNAILQKDALKPPSETSATAGALDGLLTATGDKYALYFDTKHYQYFNEESQGSFGGIGVVLGEKDGNAYLVEVYKDTPAAAAGMKPGDRFSVIDGEKQAKWTSDEVVKRVRGEVGTKVKLTMIRPAKDGKGADATFTVELTRATINLPNTETKLYGTVGYIRLGQFNAQSAKDIAAAVKDLSGKGAKSFVLDLRDNPGGLLEQAVDVTSLFVPSGVVVRIDQRNKPEAELRATGNKITDAPLVVLINGDSASASEITGGALQDYGRATLVGETSFGKGSVQNVEELSFGGAIKYTTAHYLTPKKRVIDGIGLTPDVVVKMDPEKQADPATDTQLQRALQIARSAR